MLEPLIRGALKNAKLHPAPINPDWIERGAPMASAAVLSKTDDRAATTVLWACTAGRFTWRYDIDETVYVLDGGVTIQAPGEPDRHLTAGDSIHFSRGAVATWTIESHVRKVAFCRSVPPRPFSLAMRIARALLRRVAPGRASGAPVPTFAET